MAKQYKTWYLKDAPKVKQFRSWYPPAKRAEIMSALAGSDDPTIDLGAYDRTVLNLQRTPCDSAVPKVGYYRYIHKNTMVYYYIPRNYHFNKVKLVDDDPVIRQPDYSIEDEPAPYLDIPKFSKWVDYVEFKKNVSRQQSDKKISAQYAYVDPQNRINRLPQFLFCIHGVGGEPYYNHFDAAQDKIREYKALADENNMILIAPAFERKYFQQPAGFSYPLNFSPPLTMERLAELDEYYQTQVAPINYHPPVHYLHSYQYLLNKANYYRADIRLNEIHDIFKNYYQEVKGDKFNIAGYSGGGQFVSRYMMCYPEKLNKIALGGANSYLFPRPDYPYPYGWDCTNIFAEFDKPPIPVGISKRTDVAWADDLINMNWEHKFAQLMGKEIFHFVGIDDRTDDYSAAEIARPLDKVGHRWQGVNHWEKAFNYHFDMRRAGNRLKRAGLRDKRAPFSLVFVPLVGSHSDAHWDMPKWLRMCWYNFPEYAPLIYDGEYSVR